MNSAQGQRAGGVQPTRETDKLGYIRGFDGLRAVAVSLVFIMHKTALGNEVRVGFYGVWLFFLLSGFLINSQLYHSQKLIRQGASTRLAELLSFWRRRFLRIFPAYYTILLLTIVWYLISEKSLQGIGFHLTYTTNIYYEYFADEFTSIFAHYWSLAVEEQFYLLFAPLILLIPSTKMVNALGALIVISIVARMVLTTVGTDEIHVYIDSFVNFGIIALGGVIYLYRERFSSTITARSNVGGIFLLLFLVSTIVIYNVPETFAGVRQVLFVCSLLLAAALVASIFATPNSRFVAMLELRPVAFYGRLSYGFYLCQSYVPADLPEKLLLLVGKHSLAVASIHQYLDRSLAGRSTLQITGLILCFAISMGITWVSWILIERPALRLRYSRKDKRFDEPRSSGENSPLRPSPVTQQ